jgi:hypothetical protein
MLNVILPYWRRRIIALPWAVVIGGFVCFLLFSEKSPLFVFIYMRQFGEEPKWAERGLDKNDLKIPAVVRVLKPSAVFVHPDSLSLDFGGPFFEMEIRAFKPSVTG